MAIELKPTKCEIDSTLESLADNFDLELVERNTAAPATPVAQAWRTLAKGSAVTIRLGLRDQDLLDYGAFLVDKADFAGETDQWRSHVVGRDHASRLADTQVKPLIPPGRVTNRSGWNSTHTKIVQRIEEWVYGIAPDTGLGPSASSLVRMVAEACGIALRWEADDYQVQELTINDGDTASAVIETLLEPLRFSRLYGTCAFMEGDTLVVRRRDRAPVVGMVDCSLGVMGKIEREEQPEWAQVIVRGATHQVPGSAVPTISASSEETIGDQSQWDFDFEPWDYQESRQRETSTPDGGTVSENETISYTTLVTEEGAVGVVPSQSESIETRGAGSDDAHTAHKTTRYQYDSKGCLVRKEELTEEDGRKVKMVVTTYEQVTPNEVRTTTTEWGYDWQGEPYVKKGYPRSEQEPGTLQSDVKAKQKKSKRWRIEWDTQEEGGYSATYQGVVDCAGGAGLRIEQNDLVVGDEKCQELAQQLANECGLVLYVAQLKWARPFRYRRGQVVALTNVPGIADVPNALITAVQTTFDEDAAEWTHDVTLEWWSAS